MFGHRRPIDRGSLRVIVLRSYAGLTGGETAVMESLHALSSIALAEEESEIGEIAPIDEGVTLVAMRRTRSRSAEGPREGACPTITM